MAIYWSDDKTRMLSIGNAVEPLPTYFSATTTNLTISVEKHGANNTSSLVYLGSEVDYRGYSDRTFAIQFTPADGQKYGSTIVTAYVKNTNGTDSNKATCAIGVKRAISTLTTSSTKNIISTRELKATGGVTVTLGGFTNTYVSEIPKDDYSVQGNNDWADLGTITRYPTHYILSMAADKNIVGKSSTTVTFTTTVNAGVASLSAKTATKQFTIMQSVNSVSTPSFSKSTVYKGDSITASATVSPTTAAAPTITWASSNTNTATINSSTGAITCVNAGTTYITATADGISKSAKLTVSNPGTVALGTTTLTLNPNGEAVLSTSGFVSGQTITWTTSNSAAVTVYSNGNVVAKPITATDTATVTATNAAGQSASCLVTVKPITLTVG